MSNVIISPKSTAQMLISTPLPKATRSYAPVPHKVVIESCLEALDKQGIKVINQLYTSARNGNQANGIYHLVGGDDEMNLRLQWQNSYDKSLPLAVAFGSNVIVCGNGLVMGDMGSFKRKHTGDVLQLFMDKVETFVGDADEQFKKMSQQRERMKEITMTKRTSAELIGRMFIEDEIITATQLGIIKRELDAPTYDYGVKDCLWNTYNAVTVSLKEAHPQFSMNQHSNLHNFVIKNYEKEFA